MKRALIIALAVVLVTTGSSFAYTYTTASGTITTAEPSGDVVSSNVSVTQPDWDSIMANLASSNKTMGEVPAGNLFSITPNSSYDGDLLTKVYLGNTGNLSKAYSYLNMKLYMAGSAEADEDPNYRLLTLQNGEAALTLEDLSPISGTWTETSQADFADSTLNQVDITTSPDNVILDTFTDNVTDTYDDETKIASSSNVTVSGGQVKLIGPTAGTETLRPNAAGDETNITYEYPAWYDSFWSRRIPVTINNAGANITDYQVRVDVTYDGDMQANFDDIRFTNTDGSTLLSYWIESYTASTSAAFWVKVPSIPSGTKTIYMYYGNATVSSASDGDATFIFFDDFSGDLSKWNIHIDTDVAITSGYGNPSPCLEISGGTTSSPYGFAVIGSNATYSGFQDGIIEADIYPSTDALPEIIFRGNYASNTGYKGRWDSRSGSETPWMKPPYSGWSVFGSSVTRFGIANQWQQAKLVINGSTFQIYNDSDLKSTVTDTQYSGPGEIGLANHYGSYARFDNVRVRKYASTEPTTGFGSEEIEGGHWDKVDDVTADDFSTYVYTGSVIPEDWYNTDWQYRKKITINAANVTDNFTYFPVLINRTDNDWKDAANGGNVGRSDGGDILFTSSNGTGKLDHEIEKYTPITGELIAWVEVPALSASADTELYIYYGNSGAADQWNVEGTWDSNFVMVQHLKDDPDNAHTQDSTSNNHDGTKSSANNPIEADGKIGEAQDFSSDHISCGDLGIGDNYTAECWIKADTLTGSGDQDTYGFTIMASSVLGEGYPLWLTARGAEVRLWAYESTPSTGGWRETTGAGLNTTDKFHIVATAISGSTTKVYVNGVERLSFTNDGEGSWCNIFTIGDLRPDRAIYFDGIIDEVRISNTIRSAEWIETSYNNQNAPSTFYSVEGEEAISTYYERDLYNIPDHTTGSGTVDGVTVYFRISGDNVTGIDYTGYAKAAIKINGTVSEGDEQSQTGKTFVSRSYQWTKSPDTGSDWTWGEIDALQVGVSLRAEITGSFAYCTQVYVVVNYTAYSSPGTLASINLLSAETVYTIDSFDYNASAIPSGTGLRVQFSTDNTTWYNSAGTPGGWDILSQGTNNIDLSGLGWSGPNSYYKMEFTSDGSDTPVLDEISVVFSIYYSSGDLTSSAYDAGDGVVTWGWDTISFSISEPALTDIKFQIRTAATQGGLSSASWYGPTSTSDYYTTSGTAVNSVHYGDRWIQYKAYFSGPGASTPTFSDISIIHSAQELAYTIEIIGGSYCLVSDNTSEWESGWTTTPEFFCDAAPR